MSAIIDRPLSPFVILGETYYITKVSIDDAQEVADLHLERYSSLSYHEKEEVRRREQEEKKNPNGLERLKRAEEAGPMGVLVIPWPGKCEKCRLGDFDKPGCYCFCMGMQSNSNRIIGRGTEEDWRPDDCPLRKAIGIIEPGGHVVYLREVGEE